MTCTKDISPGLSEIGGVTEVVISDDIGEFVDGANTSDADGRAALVSYWGEIVNSVRDYMNFGMFKHLLLTGSRDRFLVYASDGFYIGVWMDESANVDHVQDEADRLIFELERQ